MMAGGDHPWRGFDLRQWRALFSVMLKVDMRAGFTTTSRATATTVRRFGPFPGLIIVHFFLGGLHALFYLRFHSELLMALFFHASLAMVTATAVMVEFHSIIIAPEDASVLGSRPVHPHTFHAARLANILFYTGVIALSLATPPMIALLIPFSGAGVLRALALMAGSLLNSAGTALTLVLVYTALLRVVPVSGLKRVAGYIQFGMSFVIYGAGMATAALLRQQSLPIVDPSAPGILAAVPPMWYASWVAFADGTQSLAIPAFAVAGLLAPLLLAWVSGTRLTLDNAARLAETSATGAATAGRRGAVHRSRSTRAPERRALMLLVTRHFTHDTRFRLSILSIIPITAMFLVSELREGYVLPDPFIGSGGALGSADPLVVAVLFLPLMLKLAMTRADSHQASWVFRGIAVDHARVVLAGRRVLLELFLLPLLALLITVYSMMFGSLAHALLHGVTLGLIGHLFLQLEFLWHPHPPFSRPVPKGQRTSAMLTTMILSPFFAVVAMPFINGFIYPVPLWHGLMLVLLVAATGLTEWLLRRRARATPDD